MVKYSKPFRLSAHGSTRASAYGFSNKSVTLDGRTHVVWLDAVAHVCGRTYDHARKSWSETYYLFQGCDNHTSPALTVDAEKRLHMAYGPHGAWGMWNQGRFKWVMSKEPNSVAAWTREESFGYNSTYACLVQTTEGLDAIVYRGGEYPPALMFQKQRALGGWTVARDIVRQAIAPQYTHYAGTMTTHTDGTLYVSCHLYNVGGSGQTPPELQRSHGVVVLTSSDMGETWTDLSGEPIAVPALYEERIAVPPLGGNVRTWGLCVDSKGTVWTLVGGSDAQDRNLLLHRWTGKAWRTVHLEKHLPAERIPVDGVMTIDTGDRVHVVVTAVALKDGQSRRDHDIWGHPSAEVFHIVSDGAGTKFQCNQVTPADETAPNWLPNISLKGLHHPVEKPVILYTHGGPGEGCSPSTETEVYCVMVEDVR